jgi:cell division protein FtsQ
VRALGAALPDPRVALRRAAQLRSPSREMFRRIAAAAAALLLVLALYLLWFRDSGLVAVDRVSITGLTTENGPEMRRALTEAAADMTTLHVDEDRLRRAVAAYPIVERLEVSADFPSTLRIHVVERRPAAVVEAGGSRVVVSGDGSVLDGLRSAGALPVVRASARPGDRLRERRALRLVAVAGAAPEPLLRRLHDVGVEGGKGIVVHTRRGPDLIFGDLTRLHAKWTAAARVLADPKARGASYVDVRLPERPAAGGLPVETLAPVAPAGAPAPATPAAPATAEPPGTTTPTTTTPPTGTPPTGTPATTGAAPATPPAPTTPTPPAPAPTQPAPGTAQGGTTAP